VVAEANLHLDLPDQQSDRLLVLHRLVRVLHLFVLHEGERRRLAEKVDVVDVAVYAQRLRQQL